MFTANGNLVSGEDQLQELFVTATGEFHEDELIVRQQQRKLGCNFNA
ncbi:MAG: hypothetical protein ACREE6_16765 [Limisphaerales bacterium]